MQLLIFTLFLTAALRTFGVTSTEIVAATLCAEARGEGARGMRAVLEVIDRRAVDRHLTAAQVCLQRKQFSCWNGDRREMFRRMKACPEFASALRMSREASARKRPQLTKGATHYCAIASRPEWSIGLRPVVIIGNHKFYRLDA